MPDDDRKRPERPELADTPAPPDPATSADQKATCVPEAPAVNFIAELRELPPPVDPSKPTEKRPVNRRDLLKAAAALGLAGTAGEEGRQREGEISYVLCSRVFTAPAKKLAFSPGGSRFAAMSQTGLFRVWDTAKPARPLAFDAVASKSVTDFFWGRGEKLVVVHGTSLHAYDMTADQAKSLWELSVPRLVATGLSPDGLVLVTLDSQWHLVLVDARSGRPTSSIDLLPTLGALASQPAPPGAVTAVGMTREATPRAFVVADRDVLLITPGSTGIERLKPPLATFDEVIVSANGEMIAYLEAKRSLLHVAAFPSGLEWTTGVTLTAPSGRRAFSPAFDDVFSATDDQLTRQRLFPSSDAADRVRSAGAATPTPTPTPAYDENATWRVAAEVSRVTCVACGWDPNLYAWGGEDGRVVIGRETAPAATGAAASIDTRLVRTALTDPAANRIASYPPKSVKLPYRDCTCTCNAVSVSRSKDRVTQTFDSEHQRWTTSTQACGTPLPPGAICLCDCVAAAGTPGWVCTCDTVCTCNTMGGSGGYTLSYWY